MRTTARGSAWRGRSSQLETPDTTTPPTLAGVDGGPVYGTADRGPTAPGNLTVTRPIDKEVWHAPRVARRLIAKHGAAEALVRARRRRFRVVVGYLLNPSDEILAGRVIYWDVVTVRCAKAAGLNDGVRRIA